MSHTDVIVLPSKTSKALFGSVAAIVFLNLAYLFVYDYIGIAGPLFAYIIVAASVKLFTRLAGIHPGKKDIQNLMIANGVIMGLLTALLVLGTLTIEANAGSKAFSIAFDLGTYIVSFFMFRELGEQN